MGNFQKHPDVSQAARVGEPTLVDPQLVSATSVVQDATRAMMGTSAGDKNSAAVETIKGPLAADQPAPRSDQPAPDPASGNPASGAAGVEVSAQAAQQDQLLPLQMRPVKLQPRPLHLPQRTIPTN